MSKWGGKYILMGLIKYLRILPKYTAGKLLTPIFGLMCKLLSLWRTIFKLGIAGKILSIWVFVLGLEFLNFSKRCLRISRKIPGGSNKFSF